MTIVRFPADERRWLLSLPRIGPTVIERLEARGIASLDELRRRGVDPVVEEVCRCMHTPAWANRRQALRHALQMAAAESASRLQPLA